MAGVFHPTLKSAPGIIVLHSSCLYVLFPLQRGLLGLRVDEQGTVSIKVGQLEPTIIVDALSGEDDLLLLSPVQQRAQPLRKQAEGKAFLCHLVIKMFHIAHPNLGHVTDDTQVIIFALVIRGYTATGTHYGDVVNPTRIAAAVSCGA